MNMKTNATMLLMLLMSASTLFAQSPDYGKYYQGASINLDYQMNSSRAITSDTSTWDQAYSRLTGDNVTYYSYSQTGMQYITGTNTGFDEVGQRFGLTVEADQTVRVWGATILGFGGAKDDAASLALNLYDLGNDRDTVPSDHVNDASVSFTTDDLGFPSYFFFNEATEVDGSFVLSVSGLMNIDDTVVVYTNTNGDGTDEAIMYDPNMDPAWFKTSFAFSGLVHDLMIFPIVITDTEDGVSTEIKELEWNTNIFPNPATDRIHFTTATQIATSYSVTLTNMLGQEVFSSNFDGMVLNESIEVSDYETGNYILTITTDNGQSIRKQVMVK